MTQNIKLSKLPIYLSLVAAIIVASSCIKDFRDGETDFSGTQPVALIAEGGLSSNAFGAVALTYPASDLSDTAIFYANYAADNVAPADEQFTLSVDQDALQNYNTNGGGLQYVIMPDSDYSFTAATVTVTKGNNYAAVPVVFYPSKIDPTKNYMLPITITAAPSGTIISGNQATIYYHAIGNPLAGTYSWDFYRWNDVPDTTVPPNSTVSVGNIVSVSPLDPTTLILPEGYLSANALGLGGVALGFTYSNGVLSDFHLSIDKTTQDAIDAADFKVITAPTLISYQINGNAANHYAGSTFRFYFEIQNNVGGDRKTINMLTKQ